MSVFFVENSPCCRISFATSPVHPIDDWLRYPRRGFRISAIPYRITYSTKWRTIFAAGLCFVYPTPDHFKYQREWPRILSQGSLTDPITVNRVPVAVAIRIFAFQTHESSIHKACITPAPAHFSGMELTVRAVTHRAIIARSQAGCPVA